MSKKTFFIIFFILIVAGFFSFWLYRQGIFSKETLRLEILGPEKAKTGEEIEYTVKYKNNGNFALEQARIVFELPENSLTEDGKTRLAQDLQDIYPGDEQFIKFKARLLGKQGDLKVAKAVLSYAPKNLTVRYESETTFTTQIEETPITLEFDMPSKLEKGKDAQYSINYFSNIDYPLENLSIKIDPVSGFIFQSSDPKTLDNSEWKIQTLQKAQGGRITVKGTLNADANNTLTFSAKLGIRMHGDFIVMKETKIDVQIIEPLLFISQQVNGSSNYVASPGEKLHYEIFFRNIGTTAFENLYILTKLEGQAFDMSSIQPAGGQVQASDSLIVWDYKQVQSLRKLDVQEEGKVDFYVRLKNSWVPSDAQQNNTLVKNSVSISQITQEFSVRVSSGLGISQKAFYANSSIENSGPIPPAVGKATTYTITWDITNYYNDAKNVKVRAILPQNVSLTGKMLPSDAASKFTFDSNSREIVWLVGDIRAGTGVSGDTESLSFQVSLVPTAGQKGSVAQIIGDATVSGEDQFTGTLINSIDSGVNTNLPDDSRVAGSGTVR